MKPSRIGLAVFALVAACGGTSHPPAMPGTSVATTPVVSPRRAALAAHRVENLAHLHDYWVAGEFPLDASGWPQSVLRDAAGLMIQGVMQIQPTLFLDTAAAATRIAAAHREVRARLCAMERSLRATSERSLDLAEAARTAGPDAGVAWFWHAPAVIPGGS